MDHVGKHFNELSKQYFSMCRPNTIKREGHLTYEEQEHLLAVTVKHPLNVMYPPSCSYRKKFLKHVLAEVEQGSEEVLDDLYEEYTRLLKEQDSTDTCYKTYTLPSGRGVTIKESTNLISQGTTGLNTWQAAQCLAEWIIANRHELHKKTVLELGSGLGMTGLVALKHCRPSKFIFTDCHDKVLEYLRDNINLNMTNHIRVHSEEESDLCSSVNDADTAICGATSSGYERVHQNPPGSHVNCRTDIPNVRENPAWLDVSPDTWTHRGHPAVVVARLDWEGVSTDQLLKLTSDVDVILAADVVYDTSIVPALVRVLGVLLGDSPRKKAYMASTVRNATTRDVFLAALSDARIIWTSVDRCPQIFFYDTSVPIEILQLNCSLSIK